VFSVSNRLSDAIYMTKRVVARHPNVDLAAPYPRKLAFDGGEHMVIVKLGGANGTPRSVGQAIYYVKADPLDYTVTDAVVDPHKSDASAYAAIAYAGGPVGWPDADADRRLDFWRWWLDDAVPYAGALARPRADGIAI